jgi:hypothetical protein
MVTSVPKATLQDLHSVLEIYGANRTRWPAALRLQLAHMISSDPLAKQALKEAAALDTLLNLAPLVSAERERALAVRIVIAAKKPQERQSVGLFLPTEMKSRATNGSYLRNASAMVLVASLVLGVFAGASGQVSPTFDLVTDALGLSEDEPELAYAPDQQSAGEDSL